MGGSNISKAIEERENISFNDADSLKRREGLGAIDIAGNRGRQANIQEKAEMQ